MTKEPFIAHSELTNEIYIVIGKEKYRVTEQAIKAVVAIKALEQEPKTGHWIADVDRWGDIVTTVNGYICSECGEFNADSDKYCPNCGAEMEVEE